MKRRFLDSRRMLLFHVGRMEGYCEATRCRLCNLALGYQRQEEESIRFLEKDEVERE